MVERYAVANAQQWREIHNTVSFRTRHQLAFVQVIPHSETGRAPRSRPTQTVGGRMTILRRTQWCSALIAVALLIVHPAAAQNSAQLDRLVDQLQQQMQVMQQQNREQMQALQQQHQ